MPRPRLGLEAADAGRDELGRAGASRELERERARVDPRELEEVVDEPAERPHLLADAPAGTRPARRGRPRAPRASPASRRAACAGRGSPRRRAGGGRRRARSSLRAISLNGAAELGELARAAGSARARVEVAGGERARTRRGGGRAARGSSARRAARRRRPRARTRPRRRGSSTSSSMWNITTPGEQHGARAGARRASSASPSELAAGRSAAAASAKRDARARRRASPARRASGELDHGDEPVADAPDRLEVPRPGRRRPRSSRAAGGCGRSPCPCRARRS